ncbi:MAG: hypothetical protein RIT04_40 [Candidatus Parcubacteria bacterium]|jgi:hypothetical protein
MDEDKKKHLELLHQIIYDATKDKFSFLPLLSGIMVALLAVGSASGFFMPNSNIKHIATILLLLMMISLQFYFSENSKLLVMAKKEFGKALGNDAYDDSALNFIESLTYLFTGKIKGKKIGGDLFNRLASQMPAYALLILWFVVAVMLYELWQ